MAAEAWRRRRGGGGVAAEPRRRRRGCGAKAVEPRRQSRDGEARAGELRLRSRDGEVRAAEPVRRSGGSGAMVAVRRRRTRGAAEAEMVDAGIADAERWRRSRGVGFALAPTVAATSQVTSATMTAEAPQQELWLPCQRHDRPRWWPRRAQRQSMARYGSPRTQQPSGVVEG